MESAKSSFHFILASVANIVSTIKHRLVSFSNLINSPWINFALGLHMQVLLWTNALFTAEDTGIVEVQVEAGVPEDIILVLVLVPIPPPGPVPAPALTLTPVLQGSLLSCYLAD